MDIKDYCDDAFSIASYLKVYNHVMHHILLRLFDANGEHPSLRPPPLKRHPGRPKKAKRKGEDETGPASKHRRNAIIVCARCIQLGHNKRSSQGGPI